MEIGTFDSIRIEITKFVACGGGLNEIKIYQGGKDITRGFKVHSSASNADYFGPNNLLDGDNDDTRDDGRRKASYWILPRKTLGWVQLDSKN